MLRARQAFVLVAVLLALGPGSDALAHGRSTSTSSWRLAPGPIADARVHVRVALADLQRVLPAIGGIHPDRIALLPAARAAVDAYLVSHLTLRVGERACALVGPVRVIPTADPAHLSRSWRVRCADAGPPVLRIDPFFEAVPGHVHLARVERPDGEVVERLVVLDDTSFAAHAEADSAAAPGSGFADYVVLGVGHIATGVDHLVFLLALLLVGVSIVEVATIVTGFTVAHSVTLALGVLGVVEPLPAAIEALIGLSIVVVALENFALTGGAALRRTVAVALGAGITLSVLGAMAGAVAVPALALAGVGLFSLAYLGLQTRVVRPARLRWFVAFVFGLVHGFGFAGLLVEVGLPTDRLIPALLGFNVGVELGQLAVVAAAWPGLRWLLERSPVPRALAIQAGSTPVLAAGLYWFLTRGLGG